MTLQFINIAGISPVTGVGARYIVPLFVAASSHHAQNFAADGTFGRFTRLIVLRDKYD